MPNSSTKRPLVLLCGLLCDRYVWQDVAEILDDVAIISIVSFAGCTSISEMAGRVLASAPAKFALAGHSMGGRVAIEAFRQAPDRVTRLALLNTGAHPRRESEISGRQRRVELARKEGMSAVAEDWLPPMMSTAARENRALIEPLVEMILRHSVEDFAGQIRALLDRPNAEQMLSQINVPTLLLSGDEDQWSPVSQHEQMQERIPGSRLVKLAGVGHMSTVENPTAVAAALRSWLTD